jgi:ubiquinone/menaquinone biosynthesis C-methylase UbiE
MAEKYDRIGVGYNLTRQADPYLLGRMFEFLNPVAGGKYLDIGCGTGNYTIALAAEGMNFVGIDPSQEMLEKAKLRSDAVEWRYGKAEALPFADASIDGILASLTIHHWQDVDAGLKEAGRVLKPGSHLVIFTATPKQMEGYWLSHYFPKMIRESGAMMPTLEAILNSFEAAGLQLVATENYFVQPDLKDLFLQSGKHNPRLYFDEQVRKGISSFAAVAHAEEVKTGLARLALDIDSGAVDAVIAQYECDEGDYLFVLAEKDA